MVKDFLATMRRLPDVRIDPGADEAVIKGTESLLRVTLPDLHRARSFVCELAP